MVRQFGTQGTLSRHVHALYCPAQVETMRLHASFGRPICVSGSGNDPVVSFELANPLSQIEGIHATTLVEHPKLLVRSAQLCHEHEDFWWPR